MSYFSNFRVLGTEGVVVPRFTGIIDGGVKREIFRKLYVLTSNKYLAQINTDWIADGTIAPDIVMTDEKRQMQHNIDLPYCAGKLEPLASLYKPHVRRVARHIGLPEEFAMRIPCPGPAQLLRVGGEFNENKLRIAQMATDVVEQMVE
ncbi:MAG: GMP synthase [glutamine-hydrolyzing] subunit B, partial [Candidatus Heimdallarchaeota archaeon AB_125]